MTESTPKPAESPAPEVARAKVDPESLVMRGRPAPVTRFRRGAIIALAGLGATAIAGVGWLAFGRSEPGFSQVDDDTAPVAAKGAADVVAGAPANYGDVPALGPPLPGDLGRPILAKERQMEMEAPADGASQLAASAAQDAETERQRLAAERRAARESGVMLPLTRTAAAEGATGQTAAPGSEQARIAVAEVGADPNGQRRKNEMVGRSNGSDHINPHGLEGPVSPWTVNAGSVIAASLITGLNSDLPGMVTAQVTENVKDSVTGRTLLIPQGSRLIGSYDSVVAFGQSRALVVWQRIILPDGSSIRIDNVPATDTEGHAGLADRVDRHSWQLLKGVVLSTLLGVGTGLGAGSGESDLVRAIRESTQQSGARAGDHLVQRNLDVQPTLKVRPGWPLRIVVHKDIILRPWRGVEG